MDLYEALKSGTSAQELVDTFNKELASATKRFKEEEAKKKKEEETKTKREARLTFCRKDVIDSIITYVAAVFDKELTKEETKEAEAAALKALTEFEKEIDDINKISNLFTDAFDKTNEKITKVKENSAKEDKDLIKEFIREFF